MLDMSPSGSEAVVEAEHWRDLDPSVSQAWLTISAAMSVYLAWRDNEARR
jgi:hypothetical protein